MHVAALHFLARPGLESVQGSRVFQFGIIEETNPCVQQSLRSLFPRSNALQEQFSWCSANLTCFSVKLFDVLFKGLFRCKE